MRTKPRRSERQRPQPQSPLLTLPFRQPRNPFPPAEILTPDQIQQLHDASMHILENIGLDFLDDEALAIWQQAGAKVDRAARHVWIDRGLLLEAIAPAPATFTWRARNPARNVVIGGSALAFGPNGGMVYAMDLDNGRRPGTLADFTNFVKLSHLINTIHFSSWEQVAAHDVPVSTRHLQRLLVAFTHSDKAVMEAAHGRIITADNLEMARLVFGSLDGDPVIGDVINVNSPLRYDERMLGGLINYARAGQVCFITPFILAGAMSPVTLAAALAQQNAEALAGVALTQLVRPGAPVVYGGFTTNVDMKSGSPAFGTPEGAWAIIAGAQLARFYRLPYRASGGLTSAKTADAQSAYESLWNLWPAVMAHTNLLMHAVGWLDGGLTAAFEKFIIDAENLAMFSRFLEGFVIDDDSLALDAIAEVGPGGHHFGTEHTQAHYKTAFYQSALSDRLNFDAWQASGSVDAAQRANTIWKELLAQYEPPPLDPSIAESLRDYVARRERELAGVNLYE
ncbi:MAG: trimethylamine methyltransferase family protein [Ardenticatenaceae bacterium]|nr:trimethylamine methyltransferase family protein [Ardenticatenaceae bacterium]MCB9444100.1 trimethylamine methyltransferase family protein [Ardenticatenaceae bacterium]